VAGNQKALQKLGFDPGKIDGIMGPHTKAAIKKFQQANALAADGIVGPKTQAALAKALAGGAPAAGGAQASPVPPPAAAAAASAAQVAQPAAAAGSQEAESAPPEVDAPAGDIDQEAEGIEEDADAADLEAKAGADKAQIMQRLTALLAPFKEAVADNGPNAKRLQALFGMIRTSIDKEQFTQAGEALDKLEELLGEPGMPPPGVLDDDGTPAPEPVMEEEEDDEQAPDYGPWKAAKQNAATVAKSLAGKVAATKHNLAAGVLKEINSIIGFVNKLPDNPSPEDIDKITASIHGHAAIAEAEAAPAHFAGKVDIKSPLLDALKGLKV
jgi:hypothetical protein